MIKKVSKINFNYKTVLNVLYWILIVFVIFIAFSTYLTTSNTGWKYKVFVVNSGSMEPAIRAGSVVVTAPSNSYERGDIITFYADRKKDIRKTVTHRINEINLTDTKEQFQTKGDANQTADPEALERDQILGKLFLNIPGLGYVTSFAHTQLGFIFLVVIPVTIVIYSELTKFKAELKSAIKKKKKNSKKIKELVSVFALFLLFTTTKFVVGTYAKYVDTEISTENEMESLTLDLGIRSGQKNFVKDPDQLIPEDSVARDIYVQKLGDLPFNYDFSYEFKDGDSDFCNQLDLRISYVWYDQSSNKHSSQVYSGKLGALDEARISEMVIPNSNDYKSNGFYAENEHWFYYKITVPENLSSEFSENSCEFDFRIDAWQEGLSKGQGFGDTETLGSALAAGKWNSLGDIVINELMWMGSSVSAEDEWLELYNDAYHAVDISGWVLENAGVSDADITIPDSTILDPGDYYLISNFDKADSSSALNVSSHFVTTDLSLEDSGERIILKDTDAFIVDSTPSGVWASGVSGSTNHSMERDDTTSEIGDQSGSWHSCIDSVCNDDIYWDTNDGSDFGTPSGENHSEYDLSPEELMEKVEKLRDVLFGEDEEDEEENAPSDALEEPSILEPLSSEMPKSEESEEKPSTEESSEGNENEEESEESEDPTDPDGPSTEQTAQEEEDA